jgi:hypothetical protein
LYKHAKKVRFEPGSARFRDFELCLNLEPNLRSGSTSHPNLGPNFGPVLKSSGSNFGSELDCGIPNNNAEDSDNGTMGTRMTMTMDGDMMRQQAEGDAMMGQLLLSRFCILVV